MATEGVAGRSILYLLEKVIHRLRMNLTEKLSVDIAYHSDVLNAHLSSRYRSDNGLCDDVR